MTNGNRIPSSHDDGEQAAAGPECAGPINGPRDQVASDAHGVRWVARI